MKHPCRVPRCCCVTALHADDETGAPWLRAAVMGINDGLVSTASLMLGVGAGADSLRAMQVHAWTHSSRVVLLTPCPCNSSTVASQPAGARTPQDCSSQTDACAALQFGGKDSSVAVTSKTQPQLVDN